MPFVPPMERLLGDYNQNGAVDAADYLLWRNTLGDVCAGLAAVGNNSGKIDNDDYNVWRSHFCRTAGAGSVLVSEDPPSATVAKATTLSIVDARGRWFMAPTARY
jgi:hypothetical protein